MKIVKYYINKAQYKAVDDNGNKYLLEVDYWNNKFKINAKNEILEKFALSLLNRKHKVNLVDKVLQ